MAAEDEKEKRMERRNIVSSFLVAVFIGVAYEKMADPVQESIHASGFTVGTVVLVTIFFLTSVRFIIGNLLHLTSEQFKSVVGGRWLFDLIVIFIQSFVLIFLAGNTSLEESRRSPIGFFGLLIALYVIDIAWITLIGILERNRPTRSKISTPWAWAILNMVLVIAIVATYYISGDIYSDGALLWLGAFNLVAFFVDLVLIDYNKLM